MNKSDYRNYLHNIRQTMTPATQALATQQLAQKLWQTPQVIAAKTIGVYSALSGEIDLQLFTAGLQSNQRIALPSNHDMASGGYRFYYVTADTRLRRDSDGCLAPVNTDLATTLDVMIVPCVGVDRANNRLGHGGGVYDRLLARYNCFSIGVAYTCQKVPQLPTESHDYALDLVYCLPD